MKLKSIQNNFTAAKQEANLLNWRMTIGSGSKYNNRSPFGHKNGIAGKEFDDKISNIKSNLFYRTWANANDSANLAGKGAVPQFLAFGKK